MARAKKKQVGGGTLDINMTPMIDCTFQLIIFFILTAQIASAELVEMPVPKPLQPQVPLNEKPVEPKNRLILQAVSKEGDPRNLEAYQVRLQRFQPHELQLMQEMIEGAIADAKAENFETFTVIIRADQRLSYQHVARLMKIAAQAGATKMELTAELPR